MKKGKVHRRSGVFVVTYAVAVTAFMSYFAVIGYAPLVFYTSVLWIALPLMAYAWIRNRRRRKEDQLW